MNDTTPRYFIGWDVGAWNCDKNARSRDAIVILDSSFTIVGQPERGNLRGTICAATTSRDWVARLFKFCGVNSYDTSAHVVVAIDTPLGFSDAFVDLVAGGNIVQSPICGAAKDNPYVFRQTERLLFSDTTTPLSAITHMIGNQATKGMHAVAKFAPSVESCGVWTDGSILRAIETYPAACKDINVVQNLVSEIQSKSTQQITRWHEDETDALTCAIVAYLFANKPERFQSPQSMKTHGISISPREGWIWVPRKDGYRR